MIFRHTSCEKLGENKNLRPNFAKIQSTTGEKEEVIPSSINEKLCHMKRRSMTVVQAKAMENTGIALHISFHMLPEPRAIGRASTKAELEVVTPNHKLSPQVGMRFRCYKVVGFCSTINPAVISGMEQQLQG